MTKNVFIVLYLVFVISLSGMELIGNGSGDSVDEAKREAINNLAQNIMVEIKSEYESETNSVVKRGNEDVIENKKKILKLKTEIPLLGLEYKNSAYYKERYYIDAFLDDSKLYMYENEINNLIKKIKSDLDLAESAKINSEKLVYLNKILNDIDKYSKYRIVADYFGSNKITKLEISSSYIESEINKIQNKPDTIKKACEILVQDFLEYKDVYIYPPSIGNSREITEFASAVKDNMSIFLNTSKSLVKSKYQMTGEYKILDGEIALTYSIRDKNRGNIKTRIVNMKEGAYRLYNYKASIVDFDDLLYKNLVVSSDFNIEIRTNYGKDDLLFKKGESFKLAVKMNNPGDFFLMVHNIKKDEKYSYLIDFNDENDNSKFIYHIGGTDVNRWIELGEFEVVEPFGIETIHAIASNSDIEKKIPLNYFDGDTELYKIGMRPEEVIIKTRGFIRKNRIKKKSENAEGILVINTMEGEKDEK